MSLLPAIVGALVYWAPVRCIANLHGRISVNIVFSLAPNFSILCFGSFLMIFCCNKGFGFCVCFIFLSFRMCFFITSIVFFISRAFSFIILPSNCFGDRRHIRLSKMLPVFRFPLVQPKRNRLGCSLCSVSVSKVRLKKRFSSLIFILSGSVLYSALVIWDRASGPTPQIKYF